MIAQEFLKKELKLHLIQELEEKLEILKRKNEDKIKPPIVREIEKLFSKLYS